MRNSKVIFFGFIFLTFIGSNSNGQNSNRKAIQKETDAQSARLRHFELETAKGVVGGGLVFLNTREEINAAKQIHEQTEKAERLRARLRAGLTPEKHRLIQRELEILTENLNAERKEFHKLLTKKFGGPHYPFFPADPHGSPYYKQDMELKDRRLEVEARQADLNSTEIISDAKRTQLLEAAAEADEEASNILKANTERLKNLSPKAKIVKALSIGAGTFMLVDALGHMYVWAQSKNIQPVGHGAAPATQQHSTHP